jgi:hypothetical protein
MGLPPGTGARVRHALPTLVTVVLCLTAATAARAQSSAGGTWLLVISGAGGEAHFRETFHALGGRLADAAVRRHGLSDSAVIFLAEDSTRAPADGRSTRAGIERALDHIARRVSASDRVAIVLIGHGSHQAGVSRFNLPGPDITAAELAVMLERFGMRTVAVVNTSSASGEWVKALSGPNRIVITATKSALEGNATVFPRYFVEAVEGDGADVDKDGALSLLEAYAFARREVVRAYEADKRLLTEHAQLDDDGDGKGSADAEGRGTGDGALARRAILRGTTSAVAVSSRDPALAPLYARRDSLQRAVEELRGRKDRMAVAEYDRELERLLVALASAGRAIREGEGKSP